MLYDILFKGNRFMFLHEYGSYFYVEKENLFKVIGELEANDPEVTFKFSKEASENLDKGFEVPSRYKVFMVILYIIAIILLCRFCFSY